MVLVERGRVKGTVNTTRHNSECGQASQLILFGTAGDGGASLTLVFQGSWVSVRRPDISARNLYNHVHLQHV